MKTRTLILLLPVACLLIPALLFNAPPDQPKQRAQAAASQASTSLLMRPDLAIGKIWIVKASPFMETHRPQPVTVLKKGVKYLLYCQYANAGPDLTGFWKLGFYIDGQMVMNESWGNVPAGATQTKSFPQGYVPAKIGRHTFMCRLDYDQEVAEKDENNNQAQIDFTVIQ